MLEMKNVTKTFGSFKALDNLSLTVPKGAVYGLVGPNGAGKTTAIRHLTGVYRPDSGSVTLEGMPIDENPAAKERICCIADEPFYFPGASLEEMRGFYAGVYPKFDNKRFEELQMVFGLRRKAPLRRFSKGMQKQACFHLALCTHADVLVLDEPVDGLDPVMRRQVWSLLLDDVTRRGTTILVSSHNLRELEDICDHVGLLHRGGILFSRDLEDMKLGIHKLQCVFQEPVERGDFAPLEVMSFDKRGSLFTITARSSREELEEKVRSMGPVFYEVLPLSLEEIFISETEVQGYDIKKLLF